MERLGGLTLGKNKKCWVQEIGFTTALLQKLGLQSFSSLGSKITADGGCSHEIKRHLFLGRKAVSNLDNVLKSKDITLPTKVHIIKVMAFPLVVYKCETWTIRETECQRIDAFELWCWKRLLRVPWTARRSNQSNLKEICLKYSWEGLMLSSNTLAT